MRRRKQERHKKDADGRERSYGQTQCRHTGTRAGFGSGRTRKRKCGGHSSSLGLGKPTSRKSGVEAKKRSCGAITRGCYEGRCTVDPRVFLRRTASIAAFASAMVFWCGENSWLQTFPTIGLPHDACPVRHSRISDGHLRPLGALLHAPLPTERRAARFAKGRNRISVFRRLDRDFLDSETRGAAHRHPL